MSKERKDEEIYDRNSLISELQRIDNNNSNALLQARTPNFIKVDAVNSYAKLVEVRIEFLNLGEIDTMNEKFSAEVRIKSRWYDDEDIEEFDKKKRWYPKLFIENALADKYQEDISFAVTRIDGKSIVTETRIAKGMLEFENFLAENLHSHFLKGSILFHSSLIVGFISS